MQLQDITFCISCFKTHNEVAGFKVRFNAIVMFLYLIYDCPLFSFQRNNRASDCIRCKALLSFSLVLNIGSLLT